MKKFITLFLAIALVLSFCACGKDENMNETKATTVPTEVPADNPTEAPTAEPEPTEVPEPTAEPTLAPDYYVNLNEVEFTNYTPDKLTVGEITDEAVKQAFLDAGHAEGDTVLYLATGDNLGEFVNEFIDYEMYEPGLKYQFIVETYGIANGGYVIAKDDTSGNHALEPHPVVHEGYSVTTCDWNVKDTNEHAVELYTWPQGTYIASICLKSVYVPKEEANIFVNDAPSHDLDEEEFAGKYTFTFEKNNVPDLGVDSNYINIKAITDNPEYAGIKSILTAENGFADYAFYSNNGTVEYYCTRDLVQQGHTYRVTMRAYCEQTIGENFSYFLGMHNCYGYSTSGYQCNCQEGLVTRFNATPVEGLTNMYDITGEFIVPAESDINLLMCYTAGSIPIYVASIIFEDITA